jgi:hypothetical protein
VSKTVESTTINTDVSFEIVRDRSTYGASLVVIAIDNGFVIDGVSGQRSYATPEALREAMGLIADRFVEAVTNRRAILQAGAQANKARMTQLEDQVTKLENQIAELRELAKRNGL